MCYHRKETGRMRVIMEKKTVNKCYHGKKQIACVIMEKRQLACAITEKRQIACVIIKKTVRKCYHEK